MLHQNVVTSSALSPGPRAFSAPTVNTNIWKELDLKGEAIFLA